MSRARNKDDLMKSAEENYGKLMDFYPICKGC